jgi:polyisoprenoid-binding protein YceI
MTTMTSVAAGTWTVDLTHTRASFAARHLFGQTVPGTITVTAATIEVGQDRDRRGLARRCRTARSRLRSTAAH